MDYGKDELCCERIGEALAIELKKFSELVSETNETILNDFTNDEKRNRFELFNDAARKLTELTQTTYEAILRRKCRDECCSGVALTVATTWTSYLAIIAEASANPNISSTEANGIPVTNPRDSDLGIFIRKYLQEAAAMFDFLKRVACPGKESECEIECYPECKPRKRCRPRRRCRPRPRCRPKCNIHIYRSSDSDCSCSSSSR